MTILEVKTMFMQLSATDQIDCLKQLNSVSTTATSITEFCTKHQKMYGSNVEFSVSQTGLDHAPVITVICHSSLGDFKGTGSNQKIAKQRAVELANTALNSEKSYRLA